MPEAIITREEDRAVVQPAGDVVGAILPDLRSALRAIVHDGVRDVVLDLRNTAMVDSSGLGLLAGTHNSLQKVGGRLSVIHASPDVLQLFRTMRMHQHFAISGEESHELQPR